jgi:hypothetical protein
VVAVGDALVITPAGLIGLGAPEQHDGALVDELDVPYI